MATATANANAIFAFSRDFLQNQIGLELDYMVPDQDDGDADFGIDCFECAKVVDR